MLLLYQCHLCKTFPVIAFIKKSWNFISQNIWQRCFICVPLPIYTEREAVQIWNTVTVHDSDVRIKACFSLTTWCFPRISRISFPLSLISGGSVWCGSDRTKNWILSSALFFPSTMRCPMGWTLKCTNRYVSFWSCSHDLWERAVCVDVSQGSRTGVLGDEWSVLRRDDERVRIAFFWETASNQGKVTETRTLGQPFFPVCAEQSVIRQLW